MAVSCVNKGLELCLCTKVCVCLGVVENIVAVVGIVSKVTAGITGINKAVDLLIGSRDPDRVYSKVVKITFVDLFCNAGKIAAVKGSRSSVPARESSSACVCRSSVGVVVACVSVIETVGHKKINRCVIP